MPEKKVSIVGVVGVPGLYGGFETLAENLVRYHFEKNRSEELTVYCSTKAYPERNKTFMRAQLAYIPLDANGIQSVPYDIWSLLRCVVKRQDTVILLGVSGAIVLPLIRLISRMKVVCNIDGIEWKREKWQGFAEKFLRFSERLAVRYSHEVISDNQAIADYVQQTYGQECSVIPYGGDNAISTDAAPNDPDLPTGYALALCRIEPENNVAMILEAWEAVSDVPLVFVGNWQKSVFGRDLFEQYKDSPSITLLDPVYEPSRLRALRDGAVMYIHGHSAGGTNPSLVEMMHFGIPVVAHGCDFNRHSTENKAQYFLTAQELRNQISHALEPSGAENGDAMVEIAQRRYTWGTIGKAYFNMVAD